VECGDNLARSANVGTPVPTAYHIRAY
jgi:hypothetical protein